MQNAVEKILSGDSNSKSSRGGNVKWAGSDASRPRGPLTETLVVCQWFPLTMVSQPLSDSSSIAFKTFALLASAAPRLLPFSYLYRRLFSFAFSHNRENPATEGKSPRVSLSAFFPSSLSLQPRRTLTMELMSYSSTFLLPTIPTDQTPSLTYALVLLNQRLPRFTPLIWKHARLRLCADGGANRVYDEMPLFFPHEDAFIVRRRYKPDVIKGDMDSIRADVLDFYSSLGTKVIDESHDQDTTDLHKCITFIHDFTPNLEKSNLCVLVAGALGGRFDHEAANVNVLYRFSTIRIILLSDDCLIHLLPKTHRHEIYIQSSIEGPHCGLIPIGTPSGSTTTTGLQWDLTDTAMWFGGLVSTSNIVKGEKVTVQSDSDLLWTISIKKLE